MSLKNQSVLAVVALVGLCAGTTFAQPEKPKDAKPATPTAPAQPEKPKMPEGMPSPEEQAAMQKAYEDAAKPGPNHEHLKSMAGTWAGKVKSWPMPGATPEESTCVTTMEMFLEGRFLKNETKGLMMGKPFTGVGITGYDNASEQFQLVWVDNWGTGIMNGTGKLSADKKTMTWTMKFTDPMSKQEMTMKEIETITGPDTFTMEMHIAMPDGSDFKMMQIDYTRTSKDVKRGDAKPADTKPTSGH